MHVNTRPDASDVVPTFVHFVPALTAALTGVATEIVSKPIIVAKARAFFMIAEY
jgi:hypothetical protein